MAPRAVGRRARQSFDTPALLVRRVAVGDADLLVTFVTRARGLVSARARAALRPTSRLGALEPMHTLAVRLEIAPGEEVARLAASRVDKPRLALIEDERRLTVASELLRRARKIVAPHANEPASFDAVERGLDAIAGSPPGGEAARGARAGAELLAALGLGLELASCVRCGTACPRGAAALVDPVEGGLVCRGCGGGPIFLTGKQRPRVAAWLSDRAGAAGAAGADGEPDEVAELDHDEAALAIRIVDDAIAAHAGHPARL